MLLIPAIDLRNGHCVRLLKGDFAAETRYEYEPHELLQRYRGIGASWLHVVDLDGARDGTLANRSIVVSLASQTAVKIQVGGGVRSAAVIDDLLRNRVSRVVIGSLAVERPDEVIGWLNQFGAARICLAFDIRHDAAGVPRVRTRGWTQAVSSVCGRHWSRSCHKASSTCCAPTLTGTVHFQVPPWSCIESACNATRASPGRPPVACATPRIWRRSTPWDWRRPSAARPLLEERMTSEELRPFLPNA